MTNCLKPYPEYKNTGFSWLGEVPEHWTVRRMKSFVVNIVEQTTMMRDDDVYLALEQVEKFTGLAHPTRGQAFFTGQVKRFLPGDILFGKLRPYLAKVTRLAVQGVCVGEFLVLRVRNMELTAPFLEQQIRAKNTIDIIDSSTFGAKMPRVNWQFIGNLPIAVPSFDEQSAIVRFLDHVNRRIDRFIWTKKKVIALLNEQKQAIIHRAVTRGLDPHALLKCSGITWLGDIPNHWDTLRSKYIFREVDDRSERSKTGEEMHMSMSQKLGLVPSSRIEGRRLISEPYAAGKICEHGDLVLNRLKAHLGVFALAPQRGLISPDYTVFRRVREIDPRYFELVYRTPACRVELRRLAKGIVQGFWRLYTDDFYDIRVPVPPVPEQKRIVAQLEIDLADLNKSIHRIEKEVGLIHEYRTRLIADVVTGKLDVSEAVRRLPEMTEPLVANIAQEETEETETISDEQIA